MANNANAIRAGRANVEIGADRSALVAGLKASSADLKAWGNTVMGLGASIAGMGALIRGPILAATAVYTAAGSAALDIAQRTGLSTEAISRLGFAARQTGAGIEDIETGVKKMQKFLGDAFAGDAGAAEQLRKLGLSAAELKRLKPEEQFAAIAKKIGSLPTATERTVAALKILGKGGTSLLPLMQDFDGLDARARRLGLGMSRETAEAAHALGDAMEDLSTISKGITVTLGAALAPAMQDWVEWSVFGAKMLKDWIKAHQALVVTAATVGGVLIGIGGGITALGLSLRTMGFALGLFVPSAVKSLTLFGTLGRLLRLPVLLLGEIGAAFGGFVSLVGGGVVSVFSAFANLGGTLAAMGGVLLSPMVLTVAAVTGLGVALYALSPAFRGVLGQAGTWVQSLAGQFAGLFSSFAGWFAPLGALFGTLRTTATEAFGGIAAAIKAGNLQLASEILWAGLQVSWGQGIAGLRGMWFDLSASMQRSWVNVSTFIGEVWQQLSNNVAGAWASLINGIIALAYKVGNVLGLVSAEAVQTLQADQARAAEQRAAENLRSSDTRQQSRLDRLAAIDRDAQTAKQADPAAEQRLAGLMAKFADLNNQAAAELAAKQTADRAKSLADANTAANAELKKQTETSTGSFSAFALDRMDGGSAATQTALNTKLTAKFVRQIAERKPGPGIAFS